MKIKDITQEELSKMTDKEVWNTLSVIHSRGLSNLIEYDTSDEAIMIKNLINLKSEQEKRGFTDREMFRDMVNTLNEVFKFDKEINNDE